MRPSKVFSVLFVCTGNTCRSPMAEVMLRAALAEARETEGSVEVKVASAGTDASPGERVSEQAIAALERLGLPASGRRARRLTDRRVRAADLVLTMTEAQKHRICERWPEARAKTFVISEFSGSDRPGIQDPIGGSERVYGACARELRGEITRLVPRLARRLKERRAGR